MLLCNIDTRKIICQANWTEDIRFSTNAEKIQVIFANPETVHSISLDNNATPKMVKNQGKNLIL